MWSEWEISINNGSLWSYEREDSGTGERTKPFLLPDKIEIVALKSFSGDWEHSRKQTAVADLEECHGFFVQVSSSCHLSKHVSHNTLMNTSF